MWLLDIGYELCQPLEDLHNLGSKKKCPNDQCILQNYSWVKDPVKVQSRPIDFNEIDCESSLM